MRSVAETLRRESLQRLRAMTAAERVDEALGRAAVAAYATAHGVTLIG